MLTYREDIIKTPAGVFYIKADNELARTIERMKATQAELRPIDPREHSKDQHGKVFALCSEIADWSGHQNGDLIHWAWSSPEAARYGLTDLFCAQEGLQRFSMANVDMETCREFITFLVEFCLTHDVPTRQPLGKLTEDTEAYLYMCLLHKKCSLCGKPADLHHVDAIGMGGDRNKTIHIGRRAIALCRTHHDEAHARGVETFFHLHHLPRGIKLSRYLCKQLGLPMKDE
jgi:hypothetical protein